MRAPRVGVFASAVDDQVAVEKTREIGELIAEEGWEIVTGAGNGLPHIAVKAAKEKNARAVGFSAARDIQEHRSQGLPEEFDELFFIPQSYEHGGKMTVCRKYRNVSSVAYADAGIFIAGRCGTLNEFTNAYDMEKILGVLTGSGGVSDHIKDFIPIMNKKTAAKVFFSDDPKELIQKIKSHVNGGQSL